MKAKLLLAAVLMLALSVGTAFAAPTSTENGTTAMSAHHSNGKQMHHRHHRHHRHHMMKH